VKQAQAPPTEAVVPGPGVRGGGGVEGGEVEEVGPGPGPLGPHHHRGGPRLRAQQGAEGALGAPHCGADYSLTL
jgi:hypothetical protein